MNDTYYDDDDKYPDNYNRNWNDRASMYKDGGNENTRYYTGGCIAPDNISNQGVWAPYSPVDYSEPPWMGHELDCACGVCEIKRERYYARQKEIHT